MRGAKNGWTLLLLVLAGVVLGGFIGSLAANVSGLSWLNYGQAFGLENPLVLSLGLVVLTFGLTIKITIASIIALSALSKVTVAAPQPHKGTTHLSTKYPTFSIARKERLVNPNSRPPGGKSLQVSKCNDLFTKSRKIVQK